ncbi:MAG: dethiobiotin synthase [Succinatimonas sp.]|nr:dethiobiotin synthase [Succinatimonas sp.]
MKALFVTGTGTDIGKTYVSAALARAMTKKNLKLAYYKAAVSGAESIESSDAGYVSIQAQLKQETSSLLSYLYKKPLSPHLAARDENRFASLDKIKEDFKNLADYDYVLVEGAGGIICPVVWEENLKLMYTDIIKALNLSVMVVADAGLGTINHTVLTLNYLKSLGIKIQGVILNRYDENSLMHKDNLYMIEQLSNIKVVAVLANKGQDLKFMQDNVENYFEEC